MDESTGGTQSHSAQPDDDPSAAWIRWIPVRTPGHALDRRRFWISVAECAESRTGLPQGVYRIAFAALDGARRAFFVFANPESVDGWAAELKCKRLKGWIDKRLTAGGAVTLEQADFTSYIGANGIRYDPAQLATPEMRLHIKAAILSSFYQCKKAVILNARQETDTGFNFIDWLHSAKTKNKFLVTLAVIAHWIISGADAVLSHFHPHVTGFLTGQSPVWYRNGTVDAGIFQAAVLAYIYVKDAAATVANAPAVIRRSSLLRRLAASFAGIALQAISAITYIMRRRPSPPPLSPTVPAPGLVGEAESQFSLSIARSALNQFVAFWRLLLLSWITFYCFYAFEAYRAAVNHPFGALGTAARDLTNSLEGVCLALCYIILQKKTVPEEPDRAAETRDALTDNVCKWLWLLLAAVVGLAFVEFITLHFKLWPTRAGDIQAAIRLVSGMFVGGSLAMLVGRLQSRFIGLPVAVLAALYCYAMLQITYPFFAGGGVLITGSFAHLMAFTIALATLPLKVLLFLIILWLVTGDKLLFYMREERLVAAGFAEERWADFLKTLAAFYPS